MSEHHILSLGAGIQSTTVYLLAAGSAFPITDAVFADTREESNLTYEHLEWLKKQPGFRILANECGGSCGV